MNSGTPIWTALLAAVAALAGVLLGQTLQTRREDRNWQRQRQRDVEQRELQAIREQIAWKREDDRRFLNQLRELYTDFLVSAAVATFALMRATGTSGMPRATDIERTIALDELRSVTSADLPHGMHALTLVAPQSVVVPVRKLADLIRSAELDIEGFTEDQLMSIDRLLGESQKAMRQHLLGEIEVSRSVL